MNITKQLVSQSVINDVTYGAVNDIQYIVIHETANTNAGADAEMHARLQANGNSREASWHYTVGSDGIYQSFEDDVACWHAGSPKYNKKSIGVEIAVNSDGDFDKAIELATQLVNHLMNKYNVKKSHIIQHHKTSSYGKDCPHFLRNGSKGITWQDFLNRLDGKDVKANKTSTSSHSSSNSANSIVDYLKNEGIDSSFSHRKKLANEHGISNYEGTASQNTKLLNSMKNGGSNKSSGGTASGSVVDYMKKNGMDSSFNNRKQLAEQYGISGYEGTAEQNGQLLDKLKNGGKKSSGSNATSIVDYLKKKGIDSSYNNRKKLASQYGISNYSGTAKQNRKLLNKMQGGKNPTNETSIVDYLKSRNINSSFSNRKKLAKQHGISNYKGTAGQNKKLIRKMNK